MAATGSTPTKVLSSSVTARPTPTRAPPPPLTQRHDTTRRAAYTEEEDTSHFSDESSNDHYSYDEEEEEEARERDIDRVLFSEMPQPKMTDDKRTLEDDYAFGYTHAHTTHAYDTTHTTRA